MVSDTRLFHEGARQWKYHMLAQGIKPKEFYISRDTLHVLHDENSRLSVLEPKIVEGMEVAIDETK